MSKREERIAKGAKIRKERPLRRDPMGNINHILGDREHNRAKIVLPSVPSFFSWVCLFVLADSRKYKYIFTTPTKDKTRETSSTRLNGKHSSSFGWWWGTRTTDEEIAFNARPKIHSHSQIISMAEACFVCHICPNFQISLIYAFIGGFHLYLSELAFSNQF